MRNPFKHKHNIDHVCHCDQLCCSCGKHLWQIIRDSEKKSKGKFHHLYFKLYDKWYSIPKLIKLCKLEKLRFYSLQTGELDYSLIVK